ncbi:mas-related G-protein coupled receptor member H-like [Sphaerodactylus townsendi]|uniref:mas-related G-protein coupled receptor member H-like n=1 Tax=Sphaerodactylus townsendi TaxID=933632 RepID=UPI0020268F64|nr:mas-related G-protein coupled receptor member H-like [Sphaerodactylus townsendi]
MDRFCFGFRQLSVIKTDDSEYYSIRANFLILCSFSIVICIFGLVGNGIFLWLLTFNIKRNIFTMYLLNFSTASFGFLLVAVFIYAYVFLRIIGIRIDTQYVVMTVTTLTLFIKGHVKSQPEQRGGLTIAILLTLLLFLLLDAWAIITVIIAMHNDYAFLLVWSVYSLNAIFTIDLLIFTPIMVGSTVLMSVKICWSAQRHHLPKKYIAVLATLLFFLVLTIPLSVLFFTMDSAGDFSDPETETYFFFASVSSSVNPIIYYLSFSKYKRK